MPTTTDYRFAVVTTERGGIPLPHFVVQAAYTRCAASLHKTACENKFPDTTFDIKPLRRRPDGVYLVIA